jgi:two-component system, sensor histidine kinase
MQPTQPDSPPRAPLRILLVEDNPDGRETLQQLLSLLGHEVIAAGDGEEGLSLGIEKRPDVAIIDISLPKMDGREVAEGLRRILGEAVRLIAYTAYNEAEGGRRSAVFNDWVMKPAELMGLLSCLDRKVNGKVLNGPVVQAPAALSRVS